MLLADANTARQSVKPHIWVLFLFILTIIL
jgi:hypothetical protein